MTRKLWLLACMCFMALICIFVADADGGIFGRGGRRMIDNARPEQRITNLPEDGDLPTITVMYHDDWQQRPEEVALIEQWRTRPEWQAMNGRFHWVTYHETSEPYQSRMKKDYPVLPAIVAQKPSGEVFFKDQGGADLVVKSVAVGSNCDGGDCGRRTVAPWNQNPPPNRSTSVSVVVEPPAAPALPPRVPPADQQAADKSVFWGAAAVLAILGAIVSLVVTFAVQFHRRVGGVK